MLLSVGVSLSSSTSEPPRSVMTRMSVVRSSSSYESDS